MLNEQARELLKMTQGISNTLILEYPVTSVCDSAKSTIAFIDFSGVDEGIDERLGFFYMNELLNLLDIYEDAEVTYENDMIKIKSDDAEIHYQVSNAETIEQRMYVAPAVKEKVESGITAGEFKLNKDEMAKILKTANILKYKTIVIEMKDGNVDVILVEQFKEAGNYKAPSKFKVDGNSAEDGGVVIDVADLRKLPLDDYTVKLVKPNPEANKSLYFVSEHNPITVLMGVNESF